MGPGDPVWPNPLLVAVAGEVGGPYPWGKLFITGGGGERGEVSFVETAREGKGEARREGTGEEEEERERSGKGRGRNGEERKGRERERLGRKGMGKKG